jgi:predicted AlkP superfamily pyrophosphatase or phosphodiesterase
MRQFYFLFLTLLLVACSSTITTTETTENVKNNNAQSITPPKLVVGIVVDQMRYDYLTRFNDRYGYGGFKRLITEGYNFKNNHFNYVPTYTGPGHASVYTGTTPQNHGIISNNWYDKFESIEVYCVQDDSQTTVGSTTTAGQMSPHRLQTTTWADQNKLHTQMRGKTIGISLKDRGAILPAGHTANGAYWFEGGKTGNWITSTYYINALPKWVEDFNNSGKADSYFKTWNTLYDVSTYTASGKDSNNFEGSLGSNQSSSFPYNINKETESYSILKAIPYGNSLTTDFAIAALDGEQLGQDNITDVLAVSYSSTDYVGHNFGVNSVEVEDTYLRLDKDIERLLNTLDLKVGKGNYTVFLTSDHGAVHVPAFLSSVKIPSGYFNGRAFSETLKNYLAAEYAITDLIKDISNYQIFFNYDALTSNNISAEALQNQIKQFLLQQDHINKVFTRQQLESTDYTEGTAHLIQQGYHQKRSGDVVFVLEPSYITYSETGSTHGSGMQYDTHVPLIFYGNGINQGESYKRTEIIDIAPTISAFLGISFPNGNTGKVLGEVIKRSK